MEPTSIIRSMGFTELVVWGGLVTQFAFWILILIAVFRFVRAFECIAAAVVNAADHVRFERLDSSQSGVGKDR